MAAELIHGFYEHETKGQFQSEFPYWVVERQPEGVTDPMVVRFRKVGKHGTLLDQNACWTPTGWDCKRWVPAPPKVPKWLLKRVVHHMQTPKPQP